MKSQLSNRSRYQCTTSTQTLRDWLAEYQELNPSLKDARALTPNGVDFFRCHDAVHVVFACDTSLLNEAMANTWNLFGTTVTLKRLIGFMEVEEHKEIIGELGWFVAPFYVLSFDTFDSENSRPLSENEESLAMG